ncbi:hypothetical protein IMX17_07455 [Serratia sp. X3]|uniref:hypothetical protein n=1 Tax=Serratia sp. X3 TaxID=2780495 RepID=UPI00187631FA|nr:hypothetical protein [Serratia sp. X3]MBE4973231.1 hypothetical protein [Serratia sp. X3]
MDNKLSELSKPVAYTDAEELRFHHATSDMWPVPLGFGKDVPLYSQEYVSALLEKSKEKDERAIACVNAFDGIETERIAGKSLGEFLAGELYLNKAEPKQDGSFGFTFSGLAVQLMADCFADQFKSSGAINYLELLFEHAEVGEMTVTMQRVEGLTPAQKLAAAEQRIAELSRLLAHNIERAESAEKRLATPVRLKKVDSSNVPFAGDGFNAAVDYCVDAVRAAGFTFTVEGDE